MPEARNKLESTKMQRERLHWQLYHPLKFGFIYCDHLQCHVLAVYEDIMADFFSDNFFIHRVSEDYLTSAEIDIDFLDCFVLRKIFSMPRAQKSQTMPLH